MLNFYDVNPAYLEYLRTIDPKVPRNDYTTHKKFMCGVFVMLNGKSYVVPVSSSKIRDRKFEIKTSNSSGETRTLAFLNFSHMIPVPENQLSLKVINSEPDSKYRSLLRKELSYINQHTDEIKNQAKSVYEDVTREGSWLPRVCCDFKLLETAMEQYRESVSIDDSAAPAAPLEMNAEGGTGVSSALASMIAGAAPMPAAQPTFNAAAAKSENVNE